MGSASVLSSSTGSLVESTTYDPWGNIKTGGTKSKFLYTGQEHDSESKLHYYNARYYDPHIRRFTQPDTFIQDVYNPQSLNRYSYVLNNPLKYTDPTGHFWQKIFTPSFWVSAWQNTVKAVNIVSNIVSKVASYVRMTPPSTYKPPAPPPNQPVRINPASPPASTSTGNTASTNISGQTLRGSNHPAVQEAIKIGQQQHANFYQKMEGPGVYTNKAVFRSKEQGNLTRPDAIDFLNKKVHELKPTWSEKAEEQLTGYVDTANRLFGPGWEGIRHTYKDLQ